MIQLEDGANDVIASRIQGDRPFGVFLANGRPIAFCDTADEADELVAVIRMVVAKSRGFLRSLGPNQ